MVASEGRWSSLEVNWNLSPYSGIMEAIGGRAVELVELVKPG